ncbi:heterokaryon incompatibility protein-domain-containing protein [Hypoxylon argillaceum]|nr:heterokaryon incompatibility protein-domain-containing protein [Hypoxylon argillaceum]
MQYCMFGQELTVDIPVLITSIKWLAGSIETYETLETFNDDTQPTPPYAILSHTWGPDHEEISFLDLRRGRTKNGPGQYKFDKCCFQAARDGLSYAWIDTCCIDKKSSTELSEAINSMFKWYENAEVCYAFLRDVRATGDPSNPESSFWKSRWFQRGWTLQELIAPRHVQFYDACWTLIGTKRYLASAIVCITRIPRIFLLGISPLSNASVAQRMSWAAGRVTKRKEDAAYCLLGIFGIAMPMIYGDGDRAFFRLQEEIAKYTSDDSILAWDFSEDDSPNKPSEGSSRGALASGPSNFDNSNHIVLTSLASSSFGSLQPLGTSLLLQRCLYTDVSGQCFVVLQCQSKRQPGRAVGIPVQADPGGSGDYIRSLGIASILLPKDIPQTNVKNIRILAGRSDVGGEELRCTFYVEIDLEKDLELSEVIPSSSWDQQKDILVPNDETGFGRVHRFWTRFRSERDTSDDFILILELISQESSVQVRHHVMTCERRIELNDIQWNFTEFDPSHLNKHSASNGILDLEVTISRETVGARDMFCVRLLEAKNVTDTFNVTSTIRHLRREQKDITAWKQWRQRISYYLSTIQRYSDSHCDSSGNRLPSETRSERSPSPDSSDIYIGYGARAGNMLGDWNEVTAPEWLEIVGEEDDATAYLLDGLYISHHLSTDQCYRGSDCDFNGVPSKTRRERRGERPDYRAIVGKWLAKT